MEGAKPLLITKGEGLRHMHSPLFMNYPLLRQNRTPTENELVLVCLQHSMSSFT